MAQKFTSQKSSDNFNIHIVEDHNDALIAIYQEIGSRRILFNDLIMIHFDSHPDLGIPAYLKADSIFKKEILFENLSIENWIIPAVYAGHLNTVVWIRPPWSDQIALGNYEIIVGKDIQNELIKCNCKLSYFLSDNLYSNENNLVNKRKFTLYVCDFDSILNETDKFLIDLLNNLKERSLVFDIDLDFFLLKIHLSKCLSLTKNSIYSSLFMNLGLKLKQMIQISIKSMKNS